MKHWILALALLAAACGEDEPPSEAPPPQGRAETRSIRNTEAVGYSGNAIADKVDGALNKTDEATKKNQDAADQADAP